MMGLIKINFNKKLPWVKRTIKGTINKALPYL